MEAMGMEKLNQIVSAVDSFVWGPVMLVLLVGTGIFLTIRTRFLPWRNLGYAIKSTLSKEARTKNRGTGDVSPILGTDDSTCRNNRNRKYRRCGDGNGIRWSGCPGLDVDLGVVRNYIEILRMYAGDQIP